MKPKDGRWCPATPRPRDSGGLEADGHWYLGRGPPTGAGTKCLWLDVRDDLAAVTCPSGGSG
ncbi:hypothetical protein E2C01_081251 [Portunus trituberculatus]|uniref:Uncharacterized protein n=1 Tax=Portunus trituberculatus TaxID=210409 RepID=A0A5B7IVB5_PORTR|nr:hypothetical protein [Portunus trituberculatus]